MPSFHEEKQQQLVVLVACEPNTGLDIAACTLGAAYTSRTIATPYRAIADFVRCPADIVVLDLDAFHDGDLDAIRVFREISPAVRIIVAFSLRVRERAVAALSAGADAYLVQPFYPAEFQAMVRGGGDLSLRPDAANSDKDNYRSAMRRLALGLAHEINNPLATISGWSQMFADDPDASEEDRERFLSLSEECDRIAAVVRRLSEIGQDRPRACVRLNLDDLVTDAVKNLKNGDNGVTIESELGAADAEILGDAGQLKEALELLMADARDALDGKGRLRVRTDAAPDAVEVRIVDNGRPLSDGSLDEPYAVRTRSPNDLALLYAACSSVFRSHGGALDAEIAEDGANVFVVRLPLAKSTT